jgi:hypothetical protein
MTNIYTVEIVLDDNVPEYMGGIIRCGSVISNDENHEELKNHQCVIDNTGFQSDVDMIKYVADKLKVNSDCVTILE